MPQSGVYDYIFNMEKDVNNPSILQTYPSPELMPSNVLVSQIKHYLKEKRRFFTKIKKYSEILLARNDYIQSAYLALIEIHYGEGDFKSAKHYFDLAKRRYSLSPAEIELYKQIAGLAAQQQ